MLDTRCGFQRIGGLVPTMRHTFNHLVVDSLVDTLSSKTVAELFTLSEEHVPLACVHDDVLRKSFGKEVCRSNAGREIRRVQRYGVRRMQV